MPTVSVDKEYFFQALDEQYTTKQFDDLCFQFGIELDDDTTEEVKKAGNGDRAQLKIDIPANRYDLLCHEGISRALLVFKDKLDQPQVRLTNPEKMIEINADANVAKIRPVVLGAVLRNITFTKQNYASFIDLQDKLHQNLGRRRTLVSMGTHDLDTIEGPFTYEGLAPTEIKFAPLNKPEQVMDGPALMQNLEQDRHLARYLPIIRDSPVYPVILDKNRTVCSLPPIINSDHSKITINTKNVFIDMTGTDETRCHHALIELVSMFSQYCGDQYTVEPVKVTYPSGRTEVTPNLAPRHTTVSVKYINRCTGLDLKAEACAAALKLMGHQATPSKASNDIVEVDVPASRPDILHECDLMEDVAIAYGFNNLPTQFPSTSTVAKPLPINKLSDIVRREIAYAGWVEVLSLILSSHNENYAWLNQKDPGSEAILLENPKSLEYQLVRTSLLPGILKTLRENRKHPLPLRVFEVSDIAYQDPTDEQRLTRNERRVCATYTDKEARFEVVHGLLDKIMRSLDIPFIGRSNQGKAKGYWIEEGNDPTFLPGRSAIIKYRPGPSSTPITSTVPASESSVQAAAVSLTETGTDLPPQKLSTEAAKNPETASRADTQHLDARAPAPSAENEKTPTASTQEEEKKRERVAGLTRALRLQKEQDGSSDLTIGKLGVLHPEVLKKFELDWPTASLEFNLEVFE